MSSSQLGKLRHQHEEMVERLETLMLKVTGLLAPRATEPGASSLAARNESALYPGPPRSQSDRPKSTPPALMSRAPFRPLDEKQQSRKRKFADERRVETTSVVDLTDEETWSRDGDENRDQSDDELGDEEHARRRPVNYPTPTTSQSSASGSQVSAKALQSSFQGSQASFGASQTAPEEKRKRVGSVEQPASNSVANSLFQGRPRKQQTPVPKLSVQPDGVPRRPGASLKSPRSVDVIGTYLTADGHRVKIDVLPDAILQRANEMMTSMNRDHEDWNGRSWSKCARTAVTGKTTYKWEMNDRTNATCQTCANMHELCCKYELGSDGKSATLVVLALPRSLRDGCDPEDNSFWVRNTTGKRTLAALWS